MQYQYLCKTHNQILLRNLTAIFYSVFPDKPPIFCHGQLDQGRKSPIKLRVQLTTQNDKQYTVDFNSKIQQNIYL